MAVTLYPPGRDDIEIDVESPGYGYLEINVRRTGEDLHNYTIHRVTRWAGCSGR